METIQTKKKRHKREDSSGFQKKQLNLIMPMPSRYEPISNCVLECTVSPSLLKSFCTIGSFPWCSPNAFWLGWHSTLPRKCPRPSSGSTWFCSASTECSVFSAFSQSADGFWFTSDNSQPTLLLCSSCSSKCRNGKNQRRENQRIKRPRKTIKTINLEPIRKTQLFQLRACKTKLPTMQPNKSLTTS